MAHADRTLSEEVPGAPAAVRDFYVDPDNLILVHPLIVDLETTSRTETSDGYRHAYRVRDRIPLGPFTLRISYRAKIDVPVDGPVLTEADQAPGVRLRAIASFDPIGGGTRVTERIRFAAPRPLAAITIHECVKAHREMFAAIRRHFETP